MKLTGYWTDYIRSPETLGSLVEDYKTNHDIRYTNTVVNIPDKLFETHEEVHVFDNTTVNPNGSDQCDPVLINYTNHHMTRGQKEYKFHSVEPAPTIRSLNIGLVWGDLNVASASGINPHYDLHPYRDDGYPCVIYAVGLKIHMQHDNLHRKAGNAAISADRLVLYWNQGASSKREQFIRPNGPVGITIKDYREYWKDGTYKGFKYNDITYEWNITNRSNPTEMKRINHFIQNLSGRIDPFCNRFFTDPEDEMCFISDFNK